VLKKSLYILKNGATPLDISSGSIFCFSRANKIPQDVSTVKVIPLRIGGGFEDLTAATTGVTVGGFIGVD